MHELSIAQALIEQIERIAHAENAHAVSVVTVAVGALSGVDPEALQLAFPVAAEGTMADDARLDIEWIPSSVTCHACNRMTSPEFPFMVCEDCGADDVEIAAGRELDIKSLELATRDGD